MSDDGHSESYKVTEKDGSTSYVRTTTYGDGSGHAEVENSRDGKSYITYGTDGKIKEVRKY